MAEGVGAASGKSVADIERDRVYRKVSLRVMPFLLLCYVANYIDRTNIGIAQIHLRTDLGFTDEVYGIGVGLFFIGFILFEVPSNMLLDRIGARRTLLRIMVAWGVISTATMFVRTPAEFYGARILLGMAEAGFFPGALLYLTYWFPSGRRTRMTAVFFLGDGWIRRKSSSSPATLPASNRSRRAVGIWPSCRRCAIPESMCWGWSAAAPIRWRTRSRSGRRSSSTPRG
jgi:hypothetical protein